MYFQDFFASLLSSLCRVILEIGQWNNACANFDTFPPLRCKKPGLATYKPCD
jgi:hypothetical protein